MYLLRGNKMRRELWAIGNTFGYAVRVLNSIFCTDLKDEPSFLTDEKWLIAEQVNALCSDLMVEDAIEILDMVSAIPEKRLCEKTDCMFHHPENTQKHSYRHFQDKCDECIFNKCLLLGKAKKLTENQKEHFESKE